MTNAQMRKKLDRFSTTWRSRNQIVLVLVVVLVLGLT
jgi:hypothetical protein